nr:MAG TPA: hypothetical protein [Caudoviricetes sp.]
MKFLIWKRHTSNNSLDDEIVYSPNKYRETEGRKEILRLVGTI